jgi:hypothetical protein
MSDISRITTDELDDTALDAVSGGVHVHASVAGQDAFAEILPCVEPKVTVGGCPFAALESGSAAVPAHVTAL